MALVLGIVGTTSVVLAQAKIYRCVINDQAVFADKPCSEAPSVEVLLKSSSTYRGSESATPQGSKRPLPSRPAPKPDRAAEAAAQQHDERCRSFARQLAQIESTMRAGYNAKQGEKLRDRQRSLQEKRVAERCRS
jgi:hypothetical protein